MSVLEALLRWIRSHGGTLSRVRLGPGEEHVVHVDAPLVLYGVVAGGVNTSGESLPPGGIVLLRPGRAVVLTAGGAGASLLVCGYGARDGDVHLRDALPPVAAIPPDGPDCVTLLELLVGHIGGDGPGVVRDRLLDWLLTCTLQAWFATRGPEHPGWSTALADPVVGPALAALHAEPHRPWTVAELAARGGTGRAAFAKRFRALVGTAPLAYLRSWRMALAAEYLADPEVTVAAVARRVGYADAFTFSSAFKRERGVAPSALRA